jgi:AcrR family transcriptional regulator
MRNRPTVCILKTDRRYVNEVSQEVSELPKQAERAETTRGRLIEAAGELFGTRGYEDTSIEDVLEQAAVSKGALYHHFPSKEALFEAVFVEGEKNCMTTIATAAMAATDYVSSLRIGCQTWLDLVMDPHVRRIAIIDGPAVLGWARWRELDEEYAFGLTKKVLQSAADAGAINAPNVDMLAHMTLAMLGEAAMLIARADDPKTARIEAGEAVDRLIDALTH